MKRLSKLAGVLLLTATMLTACTNDDDLTIGNSLTSETDKLDIQSDAFQAHSRTILAGNLISRSNECYLGRLKDPETGGYVTSEFMSQLHIQETFELFKEDSIVSRYNGMAGADSCYFHIFLNKSLPSYSDSLAAMKLRVTEMATPVSEDNDYYSDYDPEALGMLRADGLHVDKMFAFTSRERASSSSYDYIRIPMNQPYTDPQGNTYNNYGTYVMQQYYRHPEYFKNSYSFIQNVCPGFYFQIADGQGFHSQVPDIGLYIYYRITNDTIFNTLECLASTDEVLQTTRITNDAETLQRLTEDSSCTYIKSPAGLFTEVTLPVDSITMGHENDSLLAARINFQRINNSSHDNTNLDIPSRILMVEKDSLETFFSKGQLYDGVHTFYAEYSDGSATSQKRNRYEFSNISSLITAMANAKSEGLKTNANWTTLHPNWNKVVLVPISLMETSVSSYYSTSTIPTSVTHNMALTSTKLVGGDMPISLNVVYAKFNTK